jgi:signal peptidase I
VTAIAVILSLVAAICVVVVVTLRAFGLVRPFSMPTGAMAPAVSPGDHILMERLTYLMNEPQRGDIIAFRTDGIPMLPAHEVYVKRLVGLPGDSLAISGGNLYVNGQPMALRNKAGEIRYISLPASRYLDSDGESVIVPEENYFVLGDSTTRSADSRLWGFVPATSVLGRVAICYWPPKHVGAID